MRGAGGGAGCRGAVSVRVVGGGVGGPGLKLRGQVVPVLAGAARSVTALLARFLPRVTLIYRRMFELSGERSRSRRPGRYLFMEVGAPRPAGFHRGRRFLSSVGGEVEAT